MVLLLFVSAGVVADIPYTSSHDLRKRTAHQKEALVGRLENLSGEGHWCRSSTSDMAMMGGSRGRPQAEVVSSAYAHSFLLALQCRVEIKGQDVKQINIYNSDANTMFSCPSSPDHNSMSSNKSPRHVTLRGLDSHKHCHY